MIVEDREAGDWILTCYYGFPERARRRDAWDLLRELRDTSSLPWCIIGDFNDLLSQQDKVGIHPHPNWLCLGFREAVDDCALFDIKLHGHPFTWIKSSGTNRVLEERWIWLWETLNSCNFFQKSNLQTSLLLSQITPQYCLILYLQFVRGIIILLNSKTDGS
jgi:hypothetical protein